MIIIFIFYFLLPRPSRDVRLLVLEPSRWSLVQKYQALVEGVSVEDLLAFSRELKEQLYAEGLVQGNLTSTVRTLAYYHAH